MLLHGEVCYQEPMHNLANWTLSSNPFVLTRFMVLLVVLMQRYAGQCISEITVPLHLMKLFKPVPNSLMKTFYKY